MHEKRTPTAADAHDLKIVVKLRAVPTSKVPFPVEIAGFPDFSRPVPVYPAFLKYVVPVQSFYLFHRLLPARVSICTQPVLRFGWAASFGYRPKPPREGSRVSA